MKKTFTILLAAAMLLTLCACGAAPAAPAASEAPAEVAVEESLSPAQFNVYSLKGPTSMGLVKLMQDSKNAESFNEYSFNVVTGADEVTAALANGDADIAMLPANAASTLYNKAGGFSVVAINTLGVLHVVENGESIQSFSDLAGKTVYLTGKGTTPEYAMTYLLGAYGIEDVTLEFKSEAAEVVTALTTDTAAIAVLPQPFVSSALMQNSSLRLALSLTDCWADISQDSSMVTGVTVVRTEVLESQPEQVQKFLEEYSASVDYVNSNAAEAAEWIAELGIVGKAAIAEKALPGCSLVCVTGDDMKTALSGYLKTLFDANPKAVGGQMPDEAFYVLALAN